MLRIGIFLITLAGVGAQSFSCPSSVITSTGVLPSGASSPVIVPANINCTYNFQIPNGYAVEFKLSADFRSDQDIVRITDSLGARRTLNHAANPITDADIWISSGTAQINVVGVSGNSTFLAKFQFTSLSAYKQTTIPTGQFFDLGLVSSGNYYTITSANNDKVIATVGFRNSDDEDYVLNDIYVYDGDNLGTAQYMGRLATLGFQNKISTSAKSLTLVNFYNSTSNLWVIGNDASTISDYQSYVAVITSSEGSVRGTLRDQTDFGSAYTFYCIDCKQFYWTQMAFDSSYTANNGLAAIQGQSPTQKMTKLLNYNYGTFTQSQLPQHIPSNMFTLSLFMAAINLTTTTSSNDTINGWKQPFDGRQGLIISPSLWTTGASPAYDHKFASTSAMKFSIDYQSLKIASTNEYASVTIDTTTTRYNHTLPNPTAFSGQGTSLQATFVGNNTQSSAIVAFRMDLVNPVSSGTTVTPGGTVTGGTVTGGTVTTQPVITTTKSARTSGFLALSILLLCL